MKKIFLSILVASLCLFLIVNCVRSSKGDVDPITKVCFLKKMNSTYTDSGTTPVSTTKKDYEFSYDTEGRISIVKLKFNNKNYVYTISYSTDNKISGITYVLTDVEIEKPLNGKYTFEYTENDKLVEIVRYQDFPSLTDPSTIIPNLYVSKTNLTYDDKGHLIIKKFTNRSNEFDGQQVYTYKGENVEKMEVYNRDDQTVPFANLSFEYDDKINPLYLNASLLRFYHATNLEDFSDFFLSKNNVKKATPSNDEESVFTLTYDDSGNLTKFLNNPTSTISESLTFEVVCK